MVGVGKVEVVVSHIRVIVDSFLYADSCSCFVSYSVISVILHLMGNHTFRTARGVTLIDPIYSHAISLVYYSCVGARRQAIGVSSLPWQEIARFSFLTNTDAVLIHSSSCSARLQR